MADRKALLLGSLLFAFALANACELNPQPEVPEANGAGGASGGGGGGGDGGGQGGTGNGSQLDAATGAGGSGGTRHVPDCEPACGVGELCVDATCIVDPCEPNTCLASEACKPSADFSSAKCGLSCAGVVCQPAETCVNGQCVDTGCSEACPSGEVCLPVADGGYSCQPNPCATSARPDCAQGEVCEPTSNSCVTDPCVGVKCPAGQSCQDGECQLATDAG